MIKSQAAILYASDYFIRAVGRAVRAHDDSELVLWIVEAQGVENLIPDNALLVVCRDHDSDMRFESLLFPRPPENPAQNEEDCRIDHIGIQEQQQHNMIYSSYDIHNASRV